MLRQPSRREPPATDWGRPPTADRGEATQAAPALCTLMHPPSLPCPLRSSDCTAAIYTAPSLASLSIFCHAGGSGLTSRLSKEHACIHQVEQVQPQQPAGGTSCRQSWDEPASCMHRHFLAWHLTKAATPVTSAQWRQPVRQSGSRWAGPLLAYCPGSPTAGSSGLP